jgi:ABC-type transporter Mla subunit MlaD
MPVEQAPPLAAGIPLMAAADLQDHLMVATHDLERLQRLLDDASQALMGHFTGASAQLDAALAALDGHSQTQPRAINEARQTLGGAITALQFQDMASQLITHTTRRLRNCADRLASQAFDGDEDGQAVVEELPQRPNPVTQDEMDAGSVDLF